ncbi:CoA transferase, partial [Citrobacter cronae]|uniref:CoA transferase n=1 Tax=Citrobacter cronae TaxID=1748967 RepID=UPI001C55542E
NDGRDARRDELYGVIDRWVASQSLEEVLAVLARAEVPASRIYSAEDMFRDPQFLAREMFLSARLPDGKPFRMPGIVPKLSATPGSADWVGPELGEHTDALLAEVGYDSEGIAALRREGAIGAVRGALHRCSADRAAPLPYPTSERGLSARFHEHGAIRQ